MIKRTSSLAAVTAAALVIVCGAGRPSAAAAQDFTWHGAIPQGQAIEIKGVNGDVRAEPSGSNQVEVVAVKRAQRDNPEQRPDRGRAARRRASPSAPSIRAATARGRTNACPATAGA